jgi:hypothetical protein
VSATAVRGFASHVEEGAHNRAIEAKLEELKAEQARLMSQLSAPRAARLREMDRAAAYGLVLEDVKRLADRAKGVDSTAVARMEDIAKFVAHRQRVMA